jgi:hypothetical protein
VSQLASAAVIQSEVDTHWRTGSLAYRLTPIPLPKLTLPTPPDIVSE